MVCGENWQEINVFENFFDFYTNRFYSKMLKTNSIFNSASTMREISFYKKLAFSEENEGNKVCFYCSPIFETYMASLIGLKAFRIENWELKIFHAYPS